MKYENSISVKYKSIIKGYHFYLLIGLLSFLGYAENTNAQSFCSTPVFSSNSSFEQGIKKANAIGPFYIKTYIHVIRNNAGLGGQSQQDVQDAIAILQQDFNQHNIFFIWDCQIDYIDSDVWFANPEPYSNDPDAIFRVNNHYDGIDIYMFPASTDFAGGRANGVGTSSEFFVAGTWFEDDLPVVQSGFISHEMGHVLNLWHPHRGCESGNWELTNGTNCATAGDFVCDTPADPNIFYNVDRNNCEWLGVSSGCIPAAPEPLSDYTPDENLIMAYTHITCMTYFSSGQAQRMRNSINTLPYLQATLTTETVSCANCEINITHNGTINSNTYEASNSITSTATIGNNQDVTYDAGNFIYLNDVFLADASNGVVFLAQIGGCNANLNNDSGESADNKADESSTEVTFKNYPNPFTGQTTIEFTLSKDTPVTLFVSDMTGRKVAVLLNNDLKTEGAHLLTFDGSNYPAGMYYYTIQAGEYVGTQKMILVK